MNELYRQAVAQCQKIALGSSHQDLVKQILYTLSDAEADWVSSLSPEKIASLLGFPSGKLRKPLARIRYRTQQDILTHKPSPSGIGVVYLELRDKAHVSPFVGKRSGTYVVFLKYEGGKATYLMDKVQKAKLVRHI